MQFCEPYMNGTILTNSEVCSVFFDLEASFDSMTHCSRLLQNRYTAMYFHSGESLTT